MSDTKHEPVIFENSEGTIVSNDPVYMAQQTLAAAGISFGQSQPLVAQAALRSAAQTDDDSLPEDDDDTPPVDSDGKRTYAELDGKALKAEAKARELDISGLKKVGEVREALRANDAEQADSKGDDE